MAHTIEKEGIASGLGWCVVATGMGHRCGYIKLPPGHPLHGLGYDAPAPGVTWTDLDGEPMGKRGVLEIFCSSKEQPPRLSILFNVHGSLTFAGNWNGDETWWLGFDCAHLGDAPDPALMSETTRQMHARWPATDGVVRSLEYVQAECESLAAQIASRYPMPQEAR